jgi:hypothetical protein
MSYWLHFILVLPQYTEPGRWDKTMATFPVQGYPLTMAIHSYDQHLVIANESDMIMFGSGASFLFMLTPHILTFDS